MTTQPQNWFRHNEAADYCRISPRTLRRWRDAGRIRAYEGKYFRDDLDRAVRNESPITDNEVLKPRDVVRVNLMTGVEKIIGAPEVSTPDLLAALQASVDRARARRGPQYLEPDTSVGPPEHEGEQVQESQQPFRSAVPDCPFFLGTGKCATGCQGPDGPACWEPAEDPEPMFEDPPAAPTRSIPDWYEQAAEDATWD